MSKKKDKEEKKEPEFDQFDSGDDIVSHYQKKNKATGASFEDRIKAFEEFNDPKNIHARQLALHAQYVIEGNPSDTEKFPGAYTKAHQVLTGIAKKDAEKVKSEEDVAKVLETYVDTFLEQVMGAKYKEHIKHAEEEGLEGQKLRDFKDQLMGRFYTDGRGQPQSVLNEQLIKELKGKKRIEIVEYLKGIGENVKKSYTRFLQGSALENIITDEDRLEVAKHVAPKFEKEGWAHDDPHITRKAQEQAQHYGLLLQGLGEELGKLGYKKASPKEKGSH